MHVRREGPCKADQGQDDNACRLKHDARAHDAVGGALLQADLPRSDDQQDNGHDGKHYEHGAIGEYALIGVGVAAVAGDDEAGAREAQAQDGGDERDVQAEQLHAAWHGAGGVIGRKVAGARLSARLRSGGVRDDCRLLGGRCLRLPLYAPSDRIARYVDAHCPSWFSTVRFARLPPSSPKGRLACPHIPSKRGCTERHVRHHNIWENNE